ncbi:predicted protein [Thalassiosira pseudonana CCMP1335]|uniref:Uncharacterized protein n=1 Tax=Thalassiosira pseudonana TaxID=35128 RepID=B5YLF9_THAPS|nr:predicted protein [Thalassiosira pseudonana CCMP1335]ACI64222.1 predicted protein [Thalassiosira pseudonana CCMP1335]
MKFHPPIVALIAVGSSSSFTAGFVIIPSSHRSPWPHSSSSQLNYYKSDEPFAERLSRSISPELLNEINAAQKALVAQVKYADKYAESIMKRGHREEAKIIKKVLSGLQSREGALVSEMKEVKLEYDEVKAAKLLGEAVEETVRSDLMVERDLMVVTERVASVLREAEAALKSVPVALGIGGDDNDDDVRENFVARLESTSHDLEQSIQTANAIASAAKKVALKDAKILDRLQEVGSDLSDAMEDTQNTIAFINEQQGEGVVDNDLVESARGVEMVASEQVIKELLAVEKLADVVANKVDIEADAVLAISTSSADTLDNAIRAVKQQSKSDTNPDTLQSKLSNYADKIAKEERDTSALADAIKSDSINDEAALKLVNSADKEITSMVNGVGDLVEEAVRNIIKVDNEELLPDEEEAESIESAAKELLEDISNIEDATEKSEESAVKRLEESIKARREKEEAEEMERRKEEEETKAESNEEHENAGESSSDEGKFEEEEESSSEESEDEGSSRQKEDESSSEENSEANEEEESIESTTKEDEGESDTTNEENVSNEKESAEAESGSDEDVASSVEEKDNEESSADDNHDADNSGTTSDHEADTEEVSNDLGDTNNSDDLEGVVAKASAESSTTESLEDVSEMSGSADEETLLASSGSEEVADVARNALEEDFDVAKDVTALEAPIGDDLLASSSGSDELDGIISSTSDMADGATLLASSEDATSTLESVHEIAKSAATEAIDTVHVLADVVATSLFL